jgi:hypothetical protein
MTFWQSFQLGNAQVGYEVQGDPAKPNYGGYTGRYGYLDSRGQPTVIYEKGTGVVWRKPSRQQSA